MASHASYNITIGPSHASTPAGSDHSSSITDADDSSGTGVQVSPTSAVGSHEYSDHEEGIWVGYPDDIGPSDSASRPRTSNQHRPIVEAPRPEPAARNSTRRQRPADRVHHHHHPVQRARRPPLPPSSGSVESNEEWPPAYGRGHPQYYGRTYAHYGHPAAASPPNYAPSYGSAQGYGPYSATNIVPPGQLVPFTSPPAHYNYPPYSGAAGGQAPGYFPPTQHGAPAMGNPMIPHPAAPYTGQEIMHHPSAPAIYPYPPPGYPIQQALIPPVMYPAYPGVASPPAANTPPPSADSSKDDEKFARIEKLFLDHKAEQEAKEAAAAQAAKDAAAKAEAEKQKADEIAAAASAAAAAATEEAEKKAAEKAAEKAAQDAAKAKAAAEEAEKKAAEADAAAAAAAAAAPPPPPPPPEEKKKPIRFKDAVGRKFSFPFHLCNTWDGMDYLIRQAFLHVEVIGPHVAEGHYDLVGPNGEIILPQVWETVIEPDWTITMHMWPMPEPPKPEDLPPVDGIVEVPPPDGGAPPPPPPPPDVVIVPEGATKKPQKQKVTPFMAWTAGRSKGKKSLKLQRKPERDIFAVELMDWLHSGMSLSESKSSGGSPDLISPFRGMLKAMALWRS
ncbi:MAG: hypothetical protein Q9218_001142 [Villophora microphyllina]